MFYLRGIVLALGLFMAAFFSYADVLLLESIRDTADVPRPAGGTTMVHVEQTYGAPEQRLGTIGDPPITRWLYSNFVVYFEYDRVIHAVVKR